VRRLTLAALVTLAAVSAPNPWAVHASSGSPPSPSIEIVGGPTVDDLTFQVEGVGWQPNSLVQLELCGNNAEGGTADCSAGSAQTVGVDAVGTFRARLSTDPPPSPCPCVVRAVSQSSGSLAVARVRVAGVPEVVDGGSSPVAPALRRIDVASASLEGSGPWTAWFGGAPKRTLVVELRNSGTVAISDAVLSIALGPADSPTGFVPPIDLPPLDVGEVRTLQVPVEFDPLSFGELVAAGAISGTSDPTTFAASTSSYPILLILVPTAIVLQLVLLRGRNAVRRRANRDVPIDASTRASAPAPADEPRRAPLDPPREIDDLVCLVRIAVDVDASLVDGLQSTSDPSLLAAYADPISGQTILVLRGIRKVQALMWALADETRSILADDGRTIDVVDRIHVVQLDRSTPDEVRAAAERLAIWLEAHLGLRAFVDGRVALSAQPNADAGPRRLLDDPTVMRCVRIVTGPPPVALALDLGPSADATAVATLASTRGAVARVDQSAERIRVNVCMVPADPMAVVELHDLIADVSPVRHTQLIGLVPLALLARIDPERWPQLGLSPSSTFEASMLRPTAPIRHVPLSTPVGDDAMLT
jgi:hypothetical protein